jgi:hypothetical protein
MSRDHTSEANGDGNGDSRTDMEVHRLPSHNKRAVVAAHNRQAAGVVRHTPLAVRVRFQG